MRWRTGWPRAGAAALACLGASMAAAQTPCGEAVPCAVAGGEYRITGVQGARGVFVWFHGYRSSAAEQIARRPLTQAVTDRGLAFAAVQGLAGPWAHPNAVSRARDETAFVEHVLDDLAARYGFGPDQVILGGFSQGASMAYYAACDLGPRAAGVVIVSGSFWNPIPDHCAPGFPPLVHVHGTADKTFPLEGRAIGGAHRQGDARAGLAMLARSTGCGPARSPLPGPEAGVPAPGLQCSVMPDCARGDLTFCLHEGGHAVDPAMVAAALAALGR